MSIRTIKLSSIVIALFALFSAILTITPANAGTGNQLCYETGGQACLNAWNNGPWVKVYTSRGVVNNDFTVIWDGTAYEIEFTGGGPWNGTCIGDAYNDPNNGYTSLDNCGGSFGGQAGWGTQFSLQYDCGGNAYCFEDLHWTSSLGRPSFLGPYGNYSNGSPFALVNSTADFFYIYPAA